MMYAVSKPDKKDPMRWLGAPDSTTISATDPCEWQLDEAKTFCLHNPGYTLHKVTKYEIKQIYPNPNK